MHHHMEKNLVLIQLGIMECRNLIFFIIYRSGITLDKVVHVINIREIHYRLIKVGGNLQKMADLFKEKFTNYEETDLKQAKDMNIKISDMIIRELLPDVVYDI